MECINFSETKAERKYYEKKKQKALRYLDHTADDIFLGQIDDEQTLVKLGRLRELVNDI